ncbi:hypothetical protein Y049_5133 [Burkholderia pseudomallei MSHR684]|nr:hypothetical protein Y049_5133 [Burkholderia pseudomallei MSHR684]
MIRMFLSKSRPSFERMRDTCVSSVRDDTASSRPHTASWIAWRDTTLFMLSSRNSTTSNSRGVRLIASPSISMMRRTKLILMLSMYRYLQSMMILVIRR